MNTNREQLAYLINGIAEFSAIPKEQGITRESFTKEYRGAVDFLKQYMTEMGLSVREDSMGTVYGRLDGTLVGGETVTSGSHLDSVREGGRFDGIAGIVTAIEALRAIKDSGISHRYPLEVVVMTEEEGGRFNAGLFSSRAMTGEISDKELTETFDRKGISMKDAMIADGLSANPSDAVRRDIRSFVELHIEQGPVLEQAGKEIGIVTGIVALRDLHVSVTGLAGHAGTTPMLGRKDPMVAAARMISALEELASGYGNGLVLTVGTLQVKPGSVNVIPYEVSFSIDLRCILDDAVEEVAKQIEGLLSGIASKQGCGVQITEQFRKSSAELNGDIMKRIEEAADAYGYTQMRLPSGAGHDSQILAKHVPTAMIFIPCKEGRSHCKEEFASTEALGKGADVLAKVLLGLAE